MTLLLFAAGFLGRTPALASGMAALPVVRLLPASLQAAGLSLLLVLMAVLPDGRFALRWTQPVVVAWCGWSLLWFTNPLPGTALDVSTWPEPLLVASLAAGFGSGLAALGRRVRQAQQSSAGKCALCLWALRRRCSASCSCGWRPWERQTSGRVSCRCRERCWLLDPTCCRGCCCRFRW